MTAEVLELSFLAAMLSAFLIGISFGSGPCNLSCLPYIGPVLLGPAANKPFTEVLLPFMSGRLAGYWLLGLVAALFGQVIQDYLQHFAVPFVAAGVTLWLALKLWKQAEKKCIRTDTGAGRTQENDASGLIATDQRGTLVSHHDQGLQKKTTHSQLFVLGFSLALNPCIPLLGLLAAAAQSADWLWGSAVALSFGLGAVVIPSLLVRYGVALLGKELRVHLSGWQTGLTRIGSVMLVLVAVNTAWRGIPA